MDSSSPEAQNKLSPSRVTSKPGWYKTGRVLSLIAPMALPWVFPFVLARAGESYAKKQMTKSVVYWRKGHDINVGKNRFLRLYTVSNPTVVDIETAVLTIDTSQPPAQDQLWFIREPACISQTSQSNTAGATTQFSYPSGGLIAGGSFAVGVIWKKDTGLGAKPAPQISPSLDTGPRVRNVSVEPGARLPVPPSTMPLRSFLFWLGFLVPLGTTLAIGLYVYCSGAIDRLHIANLSTIIADMAKRVTNVEEKAGGLYADVAMAMIKANLEPVIQEAVRLLKAKAPSPS